MPFYVNFLSVSKSAGAVQGLHGACFLLYFATVNGFSLQNPREKSCIFHFSHILPLCFGIFRGLPVLY